MPWEVNAEVLPLFGEGRYAEAKARLAEALEQYEVERGILFFNLACAEARLGETDAALEHLAAAIDERPDLRETAHTDDDLAGLRDDTRFAAIIGTAEARSGGQRVFWIAFFAVSDLAFNRLLVISETLPAFSARPPRGRTPPARSGRERPEGQEHSSSRRPASRRGSARARC